MPLAPLLWGSQVLCFSKAPAAMRRSGNDTFAPCAVFA